MTLGYFGLVLHGHMPWCKKSGTWPAGEEMIFEAMFETYIPILNVLREFKQQGIKTAITINITPILAEQLCDPYMKQRFTDYMENLISRAKSDLKRFEHFPKRKAITEFHLNNFKHILDTFYNNYYRDLLGTFKWLEDEKMIELITCGVTHGFLPLMEYDSGVFSQIQVAVDAHKKHFQREPKGIWLPECAYRPKEYKNGELRESIDYWLNNSGIEYFFVDSHGILDAEIINAKNKIGLNTNYGFQLVDTGVCVFGRNKKTSRQVWDAEEGYPGHENYREFHRKDEKSGLHYWKITDRTLSKEQKELYDIEKAQETVKSHAQHFVRLIEKEVDNFYNTHSHNGIIVSPYDFELYGHWWMEGIDWLKQVFLLIKESSMIEMTTISEFLTKSREDFSVIKMKESSWGAGGHFQVWKNPEHGWIWPYLNDCIRQLENVLKENPNPTEWEARILRQTARELILMEGSDWPFLLYTKQAKEYANQRFHHHHQRFNKLIWVAKNFKEKNRINQKELEEIEDIDSCFQNLNINHFRRK